MSTFLIKYNRFIICLVFLLVINSCNSLNEQELIDYQLKMGRALVSGLRITKDSPEVVAIWRNPQDPPGDNPVYGNTGDSWGSIPTTISLLTPFPNPTNPANMSFHIFFTTTDFESVDIWIEKAQLIDDLTATGNTPNLNATQATIVSGETPTKVKQFFNNMRFGPGYHQIHWSGRGDYGEPLPGGFYRIYLKVGKHTTWQDILLYRSMSDLPEGLIELLNNIGWQTN